MGKGMKNNNGCKKGGGGSHSHQMFKDRAKNRVDDLQGMFTDLQSARKESRSIDVAVLEEQVNQMLKEWKNELNQPSPASSLHQGGSLGAFSPDISRLLQLCDEEDDATSKLAAPKTEPESQKADDNAFSLKNFAARQVSQKEQGFHLVENFGAEQVSLKEQGFHLVDHCKGSPSQINNNVGVHNIGAGTQLDYYPYGLHQSFEPSSFYGGFDCNVMGLYGGEDSLPQIPNFLPSICPPPAAFLGPKCALWDCPRPAQGWSPDYGQLQGLWCDDYCSIWHARIAQNEGLPGMPPVIRPKGIELKDNLLFAALTAKAQGKDVGVPECEGAATAKSPWNAPDLFDLKVFHGETIREWLFFDKPRRAFESGNRKQRSLPDYNGRGWHESRKQVINESWLKRSYYMDPQPVKSLEWHLYEYEISKCDVCALYRLELKLVDGKKIPKGKVGNSSVSDLQKQMGRLTAEFELEDKQSVKSRGKTSLNYFNSPAVCSVSNQTTLLSNGIDYSPSWGKPQLKDSAAANVYSAANETMSTGGEFDDYGSSEPCNYLVEDVGGFYGT